MSEKNLFGQKKTGSSLHGKKNIIFKFRGSDHDILWFARPILPFQNDNFIQNVA
jgi:hypothetical protein